MDRIDKILAAQTGMTRKEAHKVIASGAVAVDGNVVKSKDFKVNPETQSITLSGNPIGYKKNRYFLLNKPAGVLTASTDKSRETVIDLFKAEPHYERLFAVGRLDKDTTGLLIITDDGDYAHRVISPKSGVEKEYIAVVDGEIPQNAESVFAEGIVLADGTKCLPAKLVVAGQDRREAHITVFEGKYHQIKRMLGTLELGVNKLHRKRISSILLPDNLAAGEYIEIDRETAYSVFE